MESLSQTVIDFVMCEGLACAAGIATRETLAGGPPTADITYVLSEAKSAVSFAVALEAPKEAAERLCAMDADTRALYEEL